jgi:Uma2 family endonuclease
VTELLFALVGWTKAGDARGLVTIEPAVQISHDLGYMPDIAWWRDDKCAPAGRPLAVEGSPDLVIEVLSPSTRRLDTVRKRHDYATIGVREMWFIDPDKPSATTVICDIDRQIETVLGPTDTLTSPHLDGFAITVGGLIR